MEFQASKVSVSVCSHRPLLLTWPTLSPLLRLLEKEMDEMQNENRRSGEREVVVLGRLATNLEKLMELDGVSPGRRGKTRTKTMEDLRSKSFPGPGAFSPSALPEMPAIPDRPRAPDASSAIEAARARAEESRKRSQERLDAIRERMRNRP